MTSNGLNENELIVPVVLWGDRPPTHCISCIHLSRDLHTLVTGCNDGQLVLWDFNFESHSTYLTPRCMLFGHSASILCIANGNLNTTGSQYIVSSSENGEMCLWDISDGKCIESNKVQSIHTHMTTYEMQGQEDARLICNGYYSEILVMDPLNLTILFSLSAKHNPDWITSVFITKQSNEDIIVGLSVSGSVKTWALYGNETRSSEPIYERESKQIDCANAFRLTGCPYDNKTILIVCSKFWRIYDANDYALLCCVDNFRDERWLGGSFISTDKVVIWSDHGKGYLYRLPANLINRDYISCVPSSKEFHNKRSPDYTPELYSKLSLASDERLLCPPVISFFTLSKSSVPNPFEINENLIIRGDSQGRILVWNVKDQDEINVTDENSAINRQNSCDKFSVPTQSPSLICSLEQAWSSVSPSPAGIMDQLSIDASNRLRITASVYLPIQGSLICGREDGSIVIMPAAQTIMLQTLIGKHQTYENWPNHQILKGHSGKVNCLLYPHHQNARYEPSHLLSGGVDFSVCLWDLHAGTLLYRFSVHAGEVTQLLVPPPSCNPRVLNCICSVASDHSVALLSIKERKCIMLASRHLFPVTTIKWRPLDDFLIVACGDGSLYVWQMETGLLDRVVHGMLAEEILDACDQNTVVHDVSINPALHVFRSIKFGNFDAIRSAAARGIQQLTQQNQEKKEVIDLTIQSRSNPLMIQPIKTNPKDSDSHVLLFDVESLIVHLLSDEYATMSPGMLESSGLTNNNEYQKYLYLANSPDTQHKFSGLLSKLKDTAETAAQRLQKTDMAGIKNATEDFLSGRKSSVSSEAARSDIEERMNGKRVKQSDSSLTMDIAQIVLSLLHGWGLDAELDRVCDSKLGLLRPMRPPCFGLLSKNNHLALMLPTFLHRYEFSRGQIHSPLERKISGGSTAGSVSGSPSNPSVATTSASGSGSLGRVPSMSSKHVRMAKELVPSILQLEEQRAQRFACKHHWELSQVLSTGHLLCIISLVNTLMSMTSGTFVPPQDRKRKLFRRMSKGDAKAYDVREDMDADLRAYEAEAIAKQQEQVKQGWSLLATLHCVLLPDYVKSHSLKRPLLDALAARWQDRCLEVREAAQALLLAELRRLGPKGRKQLVEDWASHLPKERPNTQAAAHQQYQSYMAPSGHLQQQGSSASLQSVSGGSSANVIGSGGGNAGSSGSGSGSFVDLEHHGGRGAELESELQPEDESQTEGVDFERRRLSNTSERRKKKSVAVILLGVIGAEYGQEMEQSKRKSATGSIVSGSNEERRKPIVEGFGAGNYGLSMQTSSALFQLLIAPPMAADHSIRRAAIDLIGRGFTVWEPYLNVSQVLIRLLELCNDCEKLVASMSFGLPLTPEADSCRTARHALGQIATSRPPAFISTLACEIARYNSMQQNAQHVTTTLQNVLNRAKPEMLRNIDLLIKSMPNEIWDLIIETMDIILHCLDFKHLKEQSLGDVFPSIISKFPNVSYCSTSRRIAVGAKNGKMAIYDLKQPKSQVIVGHTQPITCCAFSPDGKNLASYSMYENKLLFWSTATSILGWSNTQTKLSKTYNTPPVSETIVKTLLSSNTNTSSSGQLNNCDSRIARLVWINNKVTILIFSDGSEYRYMV